MVIILCLYVVALWLVFSKFKLVRWGWLSGTISLLVGGFILTTWIAGRIYRVGILMTGTKVNWKVMAKWFMMRE